MSELDLARREALKVGAGLVTIAATGLAAETWTPQVLDAHQLATVEALEELIIPTTDTPGAKTAQVHRYLDLFLNDGPEAQRVRFLNGLGWLDGYCLANYQLPFSKLPEANQIAVLESLDQQTKPGLEEGNQFFRLTKSLVSRIYYNTKIGYDELNKGGRVPRSYGCAEPAKMA